MKTINKKILGFYLTAVCLFTIYTITSIKECEAYWMHDASITITRRKLLTNIALLFVWPILIILTQMIIKIKTKANLFLAHFIISFTSILLLVAALNKPCENINGGHYMFISAGMILGYYLLKLISLIIIAIITIKTIILKYKISKTG